MLECTAAMAKYAERRQNLELELEITEAARRLGRSVKEQAKAEKHSAEHYGASAGGGDPSLRAVLFSCGQNLQIARRVKARFGREVRELEYKLGRARRRAEKAKRCRKLLEVLMQYDNKERPRGTCSAPDPVTYPQSGGEPRACRMMALFEKW